MKLLSSILTLGLLAASSLMAHDAKLHQANATTGQVTALGKDSFDLKTDKGSFKVTYSSKTVFEHGGTKVSATHLSKGATVGVIGTKLPNGELVASEVLLGVEVSAGHEKAATPAKGSAAAHNH